MNRLTPWRSAPALLPALRPFDDWMRDFEQSVRGLFEGNGRTGMPELMSPRADVAETDKEYVITLELPGLDESEVDVRLGAEELVVSGERKQKKTEQDHHLIRSETAYGTFERRFALPADVRKDADALEATFHAGMLEIRMPKAQPRPAAKIAIKSV